MTLLEFSQIIFNLTSSVAIIAVGVLIAAAAFEIFIFARRANRLTYDIEQRSAEIYRKVNGFFESIASLPLISRIFTFKRKSRNEKQ